MARHLRIEYAGAWHHVTNRGADHCATFLGDEDRRSFLYLLGEFPSRFGVEVHAYCLMGNHYHLLLHTPEPHLSEAMQRLDCIYTQRFNRRHERDGALFRGRFASTVVDSETYLGRVARYIHRNPLEAHIVDALDDYEWSSYPACVGTVRAPAWLTTKIVRGPFTSDAAFRTFVGGGTEDYELAACCEDRGTQILGGEAFASEVVTKSGVSPVAILASHSPRRGWPLDDIETFVAAEFAVSRESLHSSVRGQRNVPRMAVILLCHQYGRATFAELATRYCLSGPASVASAVHRLKMLAERDPAVEIHLLDVGARLQAA